MPRNLRDGETATVVGNHGDYTIKNVGGVYSCSCMAWRNQHAHPNFRTCKHLKAFRGAAVELARISQGNPTAVTAPAFNAAVSAAVANRVRTARPRISPPAREFQRAAAASVRLAQRDDRAMAAPAETGEVKFLLAEKWEGQNPTGWWMSEKLDGVRALWDGHRFISRLGNEFAAPQWFKDKMPRGVALDGELWLGRKRFNEASGIVRRQDGQGWEQIKFMVFDAPRNSGLFEDRMEYLHEVIDAGGPAQIVAQKRCEGEAHLKKELAKVEAKGGEGLMLRKAGSRYEGRRSSTLLKVKTFHDAEAEVIGYKAGKGRHAGRLGALVCRLPNGVTFDCGTGFSDAEREESRFPIGTKITFRYQELEPSGKPRFPAFVRIHRPV